ncbi:MAG: TonB family protein [Acidobacteriota bacterium]|nr:TonB family protein [Acidobacteriota bacterium]
MEAMMFQDSLFESGGRLKTKRMWTTLLSVAMQGFLIGILILIPLIYTEGLPKQQLMTLLVAPPPPPPPAPPAAPVQAVKVVQTDIENGQLRTPTKIPQKVAMIKEEEAPPPVSNMGGVVGGVPGGVPGGQMGGVLGGILSSSSMTAPKISTPQRVRLSQGVTEGNRLTTVTPLYPEIAKRARIQGIVVLQAVISKQGAIENLRVVSGHPMLTQAALDAVRQWRYRPYLLSGEPVEVETQITVNFNLAN